MTTPEFSRPVDVRQAEGATPRLVADEHERAALARRFGLVAIDRLEASLSLVRRSRTVEASGAMTASIVQSCAISGDDLAVSIEEPLFFRFVPMTTRTASDEEVELDAEACDEIEYSGTHIDLGEAVAQSLALAIDPFATGPGADQARARAGLLTEDDAGPFAALRGLRKD